MVRRSSPMLYYPSYPKCHLTSHRRDKACFIFSRRVRGWGCFSKVLQPPRHSSRQSRQSRQDTAILSSPGTKYFPTSCPPLEKYFTARRINRNPCRDCRELEVMESFPPGKSCQPLGTGDHQVLRLRAGLACPLPCACRAFPGGHSQVPERPVRAGDRFAGSRTVHRTLPINSCSPPPQPRWWSARSHSMPLSGHHLNFTARRPMPQRYHPRRIHSTGVLQAHEIRLRRSEGPTAHEALHDNFVVEVTAMSPDMEFVISPAVRAE